MLLNLLNLYSLIFALFSKIEGMSKELVSLQPTLQMNVTVIPVSNITEYEARLPMACFEIRVPCLPCDMVTSQQMSKPSLIINDFEQENKSQNANEQNLNYTIHSKRSKSNSILRRRDLLYIAQNLIQENSSDFKNNEKALLKEIEKIRNLSMLSGLEESNDDISEGDDEEIYDIYDTTTESNLISSTITIEDYESTSDISNELYTSTIQKSSEIPSSTFSSYYETQSSIKDTFPNTVLNTDLNIFSNNRHGTDSTNFEFVTTSYDTKHSTNENTAYAITDLSTETESSYTNTHDTSFTTDISVTNSETVQFQNTKIPTAEDFTGAFEKTATCADKSFNCSINCGDKNITKMFFISNCKIIETRCYITQCTTVKVNLEDLRKNQTNSSVTDIVYFDVNHRKMYNLSIETKKKLLKLCWETMFGQELVKLTMMDLVSTMFFFFCIINNY